MPRTQGPFISRRVLLWTAAVWPASLARADDEASPLIEIDKPVYASNELVRIWVGVQCAGRIPPESQKGGVLHMSRPDGTREAQSISWPIDGMTDRGWKGGWGPGKSSLAPGRYLFTFEWNGKRSPEAALEVRDWPLRDRVHVRLSLEGTRLDQARAVLTVENHTGRVLRFPRLGTLDSEVWLTYVQGGAHASRQSLPYPQSELRRAGGDFSLGEFPRWQVIDKVPHVILSDQNAFTQDLILSNVQTNFPVSDPEITIATTLSVFVGEADDADCGLYPVRLPVTGNRKFLP